MMKMEVELDLILLSILLVGLITLTAKTVNWVWLRPKKLEKFLRKQGLNGNPYRFLIGDLKELLSAMKQEQHRPIQISDHLPPHILPYYHQARTKYGENSFIWFGPSPRLVIADPQLMKEILTNTDAFQKPQPDPIGDKVAGGLVMLEGEKWAKHRKIINPAFHMDKLKNMASAVGLSCTIMVNEWEALFSSTDKSSSKEIDVWPYIENLSGDVICRAAFGISHEQGRRIFELLNEQMKLILEQLQFIFFPGWRFVPTKANRRLKAITKEIESLLKGMINQREKAMERGEAIGEDLLGTLMESNLKEVDESDGKKRNMGLSTEEVIDECKLFFFAGSETTATLILWAMVMLSKHQDWQARAREEVSQVFGKNQPTFDGLNRLKIVTMILHEVLRLYSPSPMIHRTTKKTVKLGNMILPVGVYFLLLIGLLHNDPKIWGDDVNEFKPERFADGIASATKGEFSFTPFGLGPRTCIGQQFAMIEAKLALSIILQRFTFDLSPSYLHAPFSIITLLPQHGVPLIFHKL